MALIFNTDLPKTMFKSHFQVSADIKAILEKPIIVEVVQGEIRQAQISKTEPEWSVNMKKALALLFQAKVDSASWLPTADNQVNTYVPRDLTSFLSVL